MAQWLKIEEYGTMVQNIERWYNSYEKRKMAQWFKILKDGFMF